MTADLGKQRAEAMELPRFAHLPGVSLGHDERALDRVKRLLLEKTESASAPQNIPWLYGLRLFNEGFFWEAHEIWEEAWLLARPKSREEHLLRSVIHLTNGALKGSMGRDKAKKRLAALAIEQCDAAYLQWNASVMGLDQDDILAAAEDLRAGNRKIRLSLNMQNNSNSGHTQSNNLKNRP